MTALKEFRVKLSVRNNLLVSRREALGISAPQLAEKLGVCYSMIWKLETLRESPLLEDGTSWSKAARKLAEFYKVLPEDLFPDAILAANHTSVEREMGAEEAFALAGGEAQLPDARLLSEERKQLVGAAVSTLSTREQKIVAMRFGLGGGEPMTRDAIGEHYGVSRERMRQIEARALSKLHKVLNEVAP